MGSKTPITHALSWFILSVIDFPHGTPKDCRLASPPGRGQSGIFIAVTDRDLGLWAGAAPGPLR